MPAHSLRPFRARITPTRYRARMARRERRRGVTRIVRVITIPKADPLKQRDDQSFGEFMSGLLFRRGRR
jgi:hypothetical protein